MGQLITVKNATGTMPELIEKEFTQESPNWIVTVYDNEDNTYEEVIFILVFATGCDEDEAYIETWEIDHLGKSVVHQGSEEDCSRVAGLIGSIGLQTQVTQEN